MVVVDRNMDVSNAVVTNVEEQVGNAIDLAPKNIRVNGISPGMIASPFNQRFSQGGEAGSAWANDNLVGRWGDPEHINGAVIFLASDESSFITGSDIKLEGAWLAARARLGEGSIISDQQLQKKVRQVFVFDAYGTLLDVDAAAREAAAEPGMEALKEN